MAILFPATLYCQALVHVETNEGTSKGGKSKQAENIKTELTKPWVTNLHWAIALRNVLSRLRHSCKRHKQKTQNTQGLTAMDSVQRVIGQACIGHNSTMLSYTHTQSQQIVSQHSVHFNTVLLNEKLHWLQALWNRPAHYHTSHMQNDYDYNYISLCLTSVCFMKNTILTLPRFMGDWSVVTWCECFCPFVRWPSSL